MLSELQKRKLVKIFSMYDTCNLGVLKLSDFEKIAETLAEIKRLKRDSAEYSQLLNQFMVRWLQLRGNIQKSMASPQLYEVSLDNWLNCHKIMLADTSKYQNEIESLQGMIFDVCDADESGNLDQEEWSNLFRAFNLPVVYAGEAFAQLDQDENGLLSKDEVLCALRDFYYSDDPNNPANFMFGPY